MDRCDSMVWDDFQEDVKLEGAWDIRQHAEAESLDNGHRNQLQQRAFRNPRVTDHAINVTNVLTLNFRNCITLAGDK